MNFFGRKVIILSAGFFLSATLFAQTRCPVGGQAGSSQCLPDDEGAAPPRPNGERIKTWGAIATSPNAKGGGGGVSSGQLSKEDAEDVALNNCKSTTGMENCKVDFVYNNQCVAFVSLMGGYKNFIYGAATVEKAVKLAEADCKAFVKGQQSCMVKLAECSEPVFKKY
jgi:Domain of unknown function (DUF4189)